MKQMYCMALVAALLFTSIQTHAEPSKPISSMMNTPSSVFDVFLFQLLEQSKCYQGWFGNRKGEDKANLCMTTIDYKFDDNLVEMNFFVEEKYEQMKGFTTANETQKKAILINILNDVAQSVGVESRGEGQLDFRLGMIQMTPIRHGWGTKGFDDKAVKEEIANRTVIHLRANIDGFVYTATRDHHGKVSFGKEKSSL